ncbi:MAG: DUF4363 family protein [Oscillospiraceae bacterium]|nr:DUF4363 family protein [Oscillospiraceae bacterium]
MFRQILIIIIIILIIFSSILGIINLKNTTEEISDILKQSANNYNKDIQQTKKSIQSLNKIWEEKKIILSLYIKKKSIKEVTQKILELNYYLNNDNYEMFMYTSELLLNIIHDIYMDEIPSLQNILKKHLYYLKTKFPQLYL